MSYDDFKLALKSKNYKFTPQRKVVIDILFKERDRHISAEEIYDIIKQSRDDMGLATVYRTLQILSDLELVTKINLDDGIYRYEINDNQEGHHHHHLICEKCQGISEVVEDLLDDIESLILEKYKFEVKNHKLKFYGICKNCSHM